MTLPKIALVGRPNVGKSALFNRFCGKRRAIVDEQEGITRDRNYGELTYLQQSATVIDTGGIDPQSKGDFRQEILMQTELAIEEADALIMVVDVQTGPTDLDSRVAGQLLRRKKAVYLAVNKVDHPELEAQGAPFYALGITALHFVSASHGYRVAELLEDVLSKLPKVALPIGPPRIPVAFLGKPNVGKSTLVNALLGDERCIVSATAGTTRDALDCEFNFGERDYTLIDTAGIRRKHKEKELVEKLAALRAESALERSKVALLMLDAEQGFSTQEKRLARQIDDKGKGCVIFFNKWDRVKGISMQSSAKAARQQVPFLAHCPMVFGSALSGRNVEKALEAIAITFDKLHQRVPTGPLNRFVEQVVARQSPPAIEGRRLRIYYAAQVQTLPPTFILFVNQPKLLLAPWKRYFVQQLRAAFGFEGVPILLYTRGKPR